MIVIILFDVMLVWLINRSIKEIVDVEFWYGIVDKNFVDWEVEWIFDLQCWFKFLNQ